MVISYKCIANHVLLLFVCANISLLLNCLFLPTTELDVFICGCIYLLASWLSIFSLRTRIWYSKSDTLNKLSETHNIRDVIIILTSYQSVRHATRQHLLDLNNILLLLNYSNKTPTKCNDDVNSDVEKTCTDKIKTDQTISIVLPVAIISIDDANVTQNSVEKIGEPIKRAQLHNAMSNKE